MTSWTYAANSARFISIRPLHRNQISKTLRLSPSVCGNCESSSFENNIAKKSLTYSHDDEVRQKIFQDGGGACRHHHPSFSQSEHRKSRQLIRPKASSRTLATGLHVLRPSGATRPRGRSALVVLRQAIELEETFTPYRSKGFPKRREWCEAC